MVAVLALGILSVNLTLGAGDVVFTLGVINERPTEPDFALAQYSKLQDYLNSRLQKAGIRVAPLMIARDVPEMANHLANQKVDAIIEGVFPTLNIERRIGPLQTTLLVWRKGQREYHTVFFSRKEGPVATLADLPGRTLVFEAHRSTSAHAMPKAYLRQRGFTVIPAGGTAALDDAIRYVFAGAELNQAYWVLHGKGDAAAFNDGDWQRLPPPIQEQLRIIARTPPIPRWLFSFRPGINPELQIAVEKVLLNMHEDSTGREALQAASAIQQFERLTAADQNQLAEWRKTLTLAVDD
ncbi:MAG: phosphate/phosphite/phosphonate ABC transporter substrate-binding protein [Candidatus Competibacteraceae bacterium]|nr:phosphate/phosphite/phosphonate ABC transporter substrate-binding protein [Candidatus Competibacteraceae bacterium]MCB1822189.1 phosphate/phosphite/phosphonate ABC transporter substrate-binding protein [Candidatus Competibacteraceae bacterium]HRY14721.1 phosphate/phosphite/phosphonate ABC transporter substrate-binding protein [Candidatus Competibacteraceae bacterium]